MTTWNYIQRFSKVVRFLCSKSVLFTVHDLHICTIHVFVWSMFPVYILWTKCAAKINTGKTCYREKKKQQPSCVFQSTVTVHPVTWFILNCAIKSHNFVKHNRVSLCSKWKVYMWVGSVNRAQPLTAVVTEARGYKQKHRMWKIMLL